MGMTIDKAIPKIQFVRNALNDDMEIAKAYDMAIETMKKYRKITEIVNGWNRYRKGISSSVGDSIYMQKVSEVLEDGSN